MGHGYSVNRSHPLFSTPLLLRCLFGTQPVRLFLPTKQADSGFLLESLADNLEPSFAKLAKSAADPSCPQPAFLVAGDEVASHRSTKEPLALELSEVRPRTARAKDLVLFRDQKADVAKAVVLSVAKSILIKKRLREDVMSVRAIGLSDLLPQGDRFTIIDETWFTASQQAKECLGYRRCLRVFGLQHI